MDSSYKPNDLVVPNVKFSFDEEREKKYMRKEAAEALEELLNELIKRVYIYLHFPGIDLIVHKNGSLKIKQVK